MYRDEIFRRIEQERERQETLHPLPNMKTISGEDADVVRNYFLIQDMLAVLVEEVGEVGSALQGEGDLKEELVQVASVCVRWLENMK